MGKKKVKYSFKITVEDVEYDCDCTVSGTRELQQEIYVHGIGQEKDGAIYGGRRGHRVEGMESLAKQIAKELIIKTLRQREREIRTDRRRDD